MQPVDIELAVQYELLGKACEIGYLNPYREPLITDRRRLKLV